MSNILLQLQVKPGQYVAVVMMEYADRVREGISAWGARVKVIAQSA